MRDSERPFIAIAASIVFAAFGSAWATAVPTDFTIGPGQDFGSGVNGQDGVLGDDHLRGTCDDHIVKAEAQDSSQPAAPHKFPTPPSRTLWVIAAQPVSSTNSLGEPVFVDLQVTNLGTEASAIDLGGNGKTNLSMTITGPDGTAKPARLSSGGVKALGQHVLGSHATYSERLILNEWNGFHEVGDYSVHVALVPEFGPKADDPPVTDLHVSIGPRNRSKLRAMANMFAAQAVDGVDFANRDAAARALSYMSDPAAVPAMKRVLMSGSDAGLPLIGTLARLGGPSARDALQSARGSRDVEVRDAAVHALRALRDGRPVSSQIAD